MTRPLPWEEGGFRLTKWMSNLRTVYKDIPVSGDIFATSHSETDTQATKMKVLRQTASVFDQLATRHQAAFIITANIDALTIY